MTTRAILLPLVLLLAPAADARAQTVLYRIFLNDGSTLVSYGEYARAGDRLVFSMPFGDPPDASNLRLITIDQAAVDWDRTERYAEAVRAKNYADTRGEHEFSMLAARVAEALNQVALAPDPQRRLEMAEEARNNLAQWPAQNYGYRGDEVAKMVSLLDEVVSELRVEAGVRRFDLALTTTTVSHAMPLMAAPTPRERMEQAFRAATLTPDPSERTLLLRTITTALAAPSSEPWVAALRSQAASALQSELRIDQAYADLARRTSSAARARTARADVRGLQGLIRQVLEADDRLGRKRPHEAAALLGFLDLRLDEARRLRLARDAWAMRLEALKAYRRAVAEPLDRYRSLRSALDDVRALAGPDFRVLNRAEQLLYMARRQLDAITPPAEVQSAHGLMTSFFHVALRAFTDRRTAVSSRDMKLAWEASSAAAGALMLLEQAAAELERLTTTPPGTR